jgi:hypothetical protein
MKKNYTLKEMKIGCNSENSVVVSTAYVLEGPDSNISSPVILIEGECIKNCFCGLVVKNFWLQIQRSWVGGLERGPLSLVRTIEELLE